MEECEHEIDFNILSYDIDVDIKDMLRFKESCSGIVCKKCGRKGLCVNNTGNFWEDEDGNLEV
jgi:hypothetical protein